MILTMLHSRKAKTMEIVERSEVAKGLEGGRERWLGGTQGNFSIMKLFCTTL